MTKEALRVKSNVKAGGIFQNHNRRPAVRVKSNVKAGGSWANHNRKLVTAR